MRGQAHAAGGADTFRRKRGLRTVQAMRLAGVALLMLLALGMPTRVAMAAPADDPAVQRVVDLTNVERQKAGLGTLRLNRTLTDAAQAYAVVLATGPCFEHTCGPVPTFEARINRAGYLGWTAIGENIAAGYPTAEAVVAGWMASPNHRENILLASFTEMGVGVVFGAGKFGTYWAEEFGDAGSRGGGADVQNAPADAPPDGSNEDGEGAGP